MGTSNLHQLLRSLCYNTQWNYAIFWKLKHRARMYVTTFCTLLHVLHLFYFIFMFVNQNTLIQ